MSNINQIAATAAALLLYPARFVPGGVVCSRAFTAQYAPRQHNEAEQHVAMRLNSVTFIYIALGWRHCDTIEMITDKYPKFSVISATEAA
jgi:hypothetical protein